MKIDPKLLDNLAQMEVDALLDGLDDEDLRRSPAFLTRVRAFLKENQLQTTPETAKPIQEAVRKIPTFDVVKEDKNDVIEL